MSLSEIFPVIITRDAERTIVRALDGLSSFPRVTVYDNGSSDRTIELCRSYENTTVHTGEFFGFGPTYNHAAGLAPGDWILCVHADEWVSEELLASLRDVDLSDASVGYAIDRHNLFMGKDVRHAGWGNDWLVRLYNRRASRFNDAPVHEKMLLPPGARTVRVRGPLWHDAVTDIDQLVQKISRHSELRRTGGGRVHPPAVILLRAWWSFFRTYVLELGVLEGWRGMVIAVSNAGGTFFRHMKRYVDARMAAERRDADGASPANPPQQGRSGLSRDSSSYSAPGKNRG